MYQCPVCSRRTIPLRYAITPQIITKPFKCGHCGSEVAQVHGWRLFVPQAPVLVSLYAVHRFGATPEWLVWFVLGQAWLLGVALWALTIRFKPVSDTAPAALRRPI